MLTIAARPERPDGCWAGKWAAYVLDGDTEVCIIHGKDNELMALVAADLQRQAIEEASGVEDLKKLLAEGRIIGASVEDELPDSYTLLMRQWADESERAL
jgi:hypothetical protein